MKFWKSRPKHIADKSKEVADFKQKQKLQRGKSITYLDSVRALRAARSREVWDESRRTK